jgi:2-methylcitrate dehydratase
MDTVSRRLARIALKMKYEDLPKEALHKAKQLLLDGLGCALGGYLSDPSRITRSWVRATSGVAESMVIGSGEKVPCANAAFANGVMLRYLDFMDYYTAGNHPSEGIPTCLAVGERQHVTGKDLLTNIVLAFEIQGHFGDASIRKPGTPPFWHAITPNAYCVPVFAGRLLGLNEDQMVSAVGISGARSLVPFKAILSEQITMMKAMGYPLIAQTGITAALLAKEGLTGPSDAIEVYCEARGGDLDLNKMGKEGGPLKILGDAIKKYDAEMLIQAPVDALLKLLREHPLVPDEIEEIHLTTSGFAIKILAYPGTYQPETKETSDHSIPYCIAVALLEGELGAEQYAREQWKDPKVRGLIAKVKCSANPEYANAPPATCPAVLEIRTKRGDVYSSRVDHARGTPENPMTDEEVQAKFRGLASRLMSKGRIDRIIETVYTMEAESEITPLMKLLVV